MWGQYILGLLPLSLDSTILVDDLIVETFYRFRTSELFNIWMPRFCMDPKYMTNQKCIAPNTWLTHQLEEDVGYKFLHFINNKDQEALDYKTLRRKDVVASFGENKATFTFCMCSPCILLCDGI